MHLTVYQRPNEQIECTIHPIEWVFNLYREVDVSKEVFEIIMRGTIEQAREQMSLLLK